MMNTMVKAIHAEAMITAAEATDTDIHAAAKIAEVTKHRHTKNGNKVDFVTVFDSTYSRYFNRDF